MESETSSTLNCGRPVSNELKLGTRKRITELLDRLKQYLIEHNQNITEQRWQIAEAILGSKQHSTAQEMVKIVQEQYPSISTATIYRNIKTLVEAKLLKESLIDSENRVVYEPYDEDHHDHIVCLDCGHIFEFHSEKVEKAQQDILTQHEFEEESHRHILYGRCAYIQKKEK